jgi:predicted phosphate transport protein (TIGR00153 family)
MASFQDLIRFLLPREDHWYDMLEELARLGHSGATALSAFKDTPASKVRETVQAIEHKADNVVRKMEDALARTFVTPIDREDLHRLTGQLDDIIDLCNLAARAFNLYHLEKPTPAMIQIMEKLVECTKLLSEAVPFLRTHQFTELIGAGRQVRILEKEVDTIYRQAISSLFSESHADFRELLKQKEALDDLEAAVDYCDNVADLLSNLAVKNG